MEDTFRREYKPLNDVQKEDMESVKVQAEMLLDKFNDIVPKAERSERSRCMAIARTKLEETIMWAVKGITA